ncbi:MAG: histidine phosphatase family protein [Pseudomonadota bacterium]
MKILGLLRHAKSDWDDTTKRDFDRGLNDRGHRGAALIGKHITDHGIQWQVLVASPAARVKATLADALPQHTPIFDDRLYLASSDTIIETVENHGGDHDAILVAGHNPGLQDALLDLVSPARENDLFREAVVKFPTATFAVLELTIDNWSELRKHVATLTHFARPRDLDPELGPES